jgi:hypothetical protein
VRVTTLDTKKRINPPGALPAATQARLIRKSCNART